MEQAPTKQISSVRQRRMSERISMGKQEPVEWLTEQKASRIAGQKLY
jgi:hypothetical protein